MNYIKQLQADKAEALDSARSIEAAINHLISYLSCPKFHVDTRVQVGDVLHNLLSRETPFRFAHRFITSFCFA